MRHWLQDKNLRPVATLEKQISKQIASNLKENFTKTRFPSSEQFREKKSSMLRTQTCSH